MKRRLSLALLLACFLTIVSPIQRGDAHFAVTIPLRSYCSAAIDSITPVKRRPGVWRYALTGNLPGSIAANLVLGTKHAWYAIQVSGVNLVDDTGTYRSNVLTFRRREYRSRAHFFVLPSGAGALLTAWVSAAGATDGSVLYACPRMPWFADESTTHKKTPWHADTYVRTNASVFDPNARPAATAALSLATTTTISGGDPTCKQFYVNAQTIKASSPHFPSGYNPLRHSAEAKIMVEVGRHNNVVGAVVWAPTGAPGFDREALRAAELSTYRSAQLLCQPVPSKWLYELTFYERHPA